VRDLPDGIALVDLDTLLATSDIVSLHATLTGETRGMLDRTRLERLKPGAAFINTARGGIVDEVALAEIARAKDLRLALDVFATKPLAADSSLRDLPGAILTPHMVGHTRELDESQVAAAFENVTRVLAGHLPLYLCNRDGIAAWQRRWAQAPAHS
jgi:D-3-phosphoglycerate dehydrogenase